MTAKKNFTKEKNITSDGEVFRLLFENHPVPMVIYDLKTLSFLRVNTAAVEQYGYSRAELQKMTLADILPEIEVARLLKDLKHRSSSLRHLGEWHNRLKNGDIIVVEVNSHVLEFENRKAVLVTAQNVTERRNAEEISKLAEAHYRSIFDNATVGIYQSTQQGRFLSVNPAMAQIFGYDSPVDMLNGIASIEKQYYVDSADRKEFQRMMNEKDEAREFCSRNYRKNGERIWIREDARVVKDDHGNIQYYEGFVTDITEQKYAEDGLRRAKDSLETANRELGNVLAREQQLARTDGLTGLFNYRYFFEIALHEFNASMRYLRPLSILMFDADGFKQINDTFGHLVGDAMLTKMAEVVTAQMRSVDVLARYGGDEFVILLSQTTAQQAFLIAERIRASVDAFRLQVEQESLAVTLSIGVAELCRDPKDDSVERIVQRADKALYTAKQAGRNCTVIFQPE